MPVKITRSQRRLKALTFTEIAKPRFFRIVRKFIKQEIISAIESGRSPVAKGGTDPSGTSGKLRYQKYSRSYEKQMKYLENKRPRPVNLKLTGKLLNSIKVRAVKDGVRVWFSDEKAKYHDKLGAGRAKVLRRMLPHDGEQWNNGIRKRIANALGNAIKLVTK